GQAYVTGNTASVNFPTKNAFQSAFAGSGDNNFGDAFVTKLSADGKTLVYSTFIGGSGDDVGFGIAVDAAGSAYVTGASSPGFPIRNALQPTYGGGSSDAFVLKLTPAGNDLVYSTFLGGSS